MKTSFSSMFYVAVGAYLLIFLLPDFLSLGNDHDTQRIGGMIFLSFMWCWWCVTTYLSKTNQLSPLLQKHTLLVGLVGLFAVLGLVSAIQAQFIDWALLEWSWLLMVMLCILFVADFRLRIGVKFDLVVLSILVAACLVYLVGFLAAYSSIFAGIPLGVWDLFYGFSNVRFFGQFQTMTLPLIAVIVLAGKPLWRKLSLMLLGCWWMLSIASGTRGTWLAMLVAFFVLTVAGKKTGRKWGAVQIWGIGIGLFLYGLLFIALPEWVGYKAVLINRLPNFTALSSREVLWAHSWELIKAHPFFGTGPMHFAIEPNGVGAHPHNSVLQIAAEWGLPAAVSLFIVVGYCLWRFLIFVRQNQDGSFDRSALIVGLFAALLAATTQSLVDGIIVMPYSQIVLMVLVGWSIGLCLTEDKMSVITCLKRRAWNVSLAATGFFLFLIISWTAAPAVTHLDAREDAYSKRYGNYFFPRFWRQGWIDQ